MSMQVAGSETSASTIMFALWMLARHPDCQERLREDLRETLSKFGGEISYETAQECKYLDMVFKGMGQRDRKQLVCLEQRK